MSRLRLRSGERSRSRRCGGILTGLQLLHSFQEKQMIYSGLGWWRSLVRVCGGGVLRVAWWSGVGGAGDGETQPARDRESGCG